MAMAIRVYTKKNRAEQTGTMVGVRLQPELLAIVDHWAEDNGGLTRPEAVRRLIDRGVRRTTNLMRGS